MRNTGTRYIDDGITYTTFYYDNILIKYEIVITSGILADMVKITISQ